MEGVARVPSCMLVSNGRGVCSCQEVRVDDRAKWLGWMLVPSGKGVCSCQAWCFCMASITPNNT